MTGLPSFNYEITFPDFDPSDAIRADIEKYLVKIEKLYDKIIFCHVSVRAPHRHQRKHIYHINIQLEIPGEDIIINKEPEKDYSHTDIHLAIRDAFNSLKRSLRKRVKGKKTKLKTIETHDYAMIKSFDSNQGFGFVADSSGREIYFHKNSIINFNPDELKPGLKVKFVEEPGEKGQHVTSMSVVGSYSKSS